jgi:hypothetical protein
MSAVADAATSAFPVDLAASPASGCDPLA